MGSMPLSHTLTSGYRDKHDPMFASPQSEKQACSWAEAPVKRGCLLPGVHVHPLGKKSRFFTRPHACPPPPGLEPLVCGDKASTTGLSWDGKESSTPTPSARGLGDSAGPREARGHKQPIQSPILERRGPWNSLRMSPPARKAQGQSAFRVRGPGCATRTPGK